MPCDVDRTPTERNEAGSISSPDQEAALLTGSTARDVPMLSFVLTWMIRTSTQFLSVPTQGRAGAFLELLRARRVGGRSVKAVSGRFVMKRSGVRHGHPRHVPDAHPTTLR
jgi:hypothetical protein